MSLITLADAKTQLAITSTDHDVELQDYINATGRVVEHYIGPVDAREVIEVVHPRGPLFTVATTPVLSLTSLAPIYDGTPTYDVTDLDLDPVTGVVRHRQLWCLIGPQRVTYQAGRSVVPPNAALAARMIVQHLWSTRRGGSRRPGMGTSDDIIEQQMVSVMGFSVPRRAVELLQADAVPVIA